MAPEAIEELLRTRHHLRVGRHTAAYIAAQLARPGGPIRILAADARTGVPLPHHLDPRELAGAPQSPPPALER